MTLKRVFQAVIVLVAVGSCGACSMFGYQSVSLQSELINDGNRLLTLQGSADLPSGTPVAATISENDTVLESVTSKVEGGAYVLSLDVSDLVGNTRYNLDIFTEPSLWDKAQFKKLGERGQYMMGAQVEERGNEYRLCEHFAVVLPMDKREAAIRQVKNGNYAYAVEALEDVLGANPHDMQAQAWLALALAHNNKAERHLGSRACAMLRSLKMEELPLRLRNSCQIWLERWQEEEADLLAKRERSQAIAQHRLEAKQRLLQIVPGKSMADIELGVDSKRVFSVCPLHGTLDWESELVSFAIPERHIEVIFDGATRQVAEIVTTSPQLRLSGDIGVGSDLLAVQERFPGGELSFDESSEGVSAQDADDVVEVLQGQYVHKNGVVFGIRREVMALGLTIDTVVSVSVVENLW